MNRVYTLQIELMKVISAQNVSIERDETLDWERLHSTSCARLAWILALERGANPELASAAAAVHDFGRILTGVQNNHAEAGYLPVQDFLKSTALFNDKEIAVIAQAVRNHSRKTVIGDVIDEIVKDADVIDCYHFGMPFDRPEKEKRYNAWLKTHQYPGLPDCY